MDISVVCARVCVRYYFWKEAIQHYSLLLLTKVPLVLYNTQLHNLRNYIVPHATHCPKYKYGRINITIYI